MKFLRTQFNGGKKRSGFAILMVLVAVVIVMLLYFLDLRALFGPFLSGKKAGASDSRPWLEENLIVAPDAKIKRPRQPKPELIEAFTLTSSVTRNQNDRGTVTIEFDTAGRLRGSWSCRYSQDERDYTYEATFAGNINAKKTYSDEQGRDRSKLYFITKGDYLRTIFNNQTNREAAVSGIIYITGWLNPDYTASGLITITTDKSWSATYDWSTKP